LSQTVPPCPKCERPLREMGFRFSGGKIVPRYVFELRGVQIRGHFLGVDYACLNCEVSVLKPGPAPRLPF